VQTKKKAFIILNISKPIKKFLKKSSIILLVIVAIIGVFISSGNNHLPKELRIKLTDFFVPAISYITSFFDKVHDYRYNFTDIWLLREINSELIKENKELKSRLIDMSGIIYENEELKRLLSYTDKYNYEYITTQVVGNLSSPFISSILLNAGKNRLIKEGQAVVNEDGLVGRISEVGEYSSRVLLITDLKSRLPVKTLITGEKAVMSGVNNFYPELKYLSVESTLQDSEIVVTTGEGGLYPPGLKIGNVFKTKGEIEKVAPFFKASDLNYVSVINYKPIDRKYIQVDVEDANEN
jgi:rod shape-determining protein MreC